VEDFRNDIARIKCNPKNFNRQAYGNVKDLILFYTKTKSSIWNEPSEPLNDTDIKRLFKKVDSDGRRYTTVPIHALGETKKMDRLDRSGKVCIQQKDDIGARVLRS
jgi:adenine-specific DNA-methyltransferase